MHSGVIGNRAADQPMSDGRSQGFVGQDKWEAEIMASSGVAVAGYAAMLLDLELLKSLQLYLYFITYIRHNTHSVSRAVTSVVICYIDCTLTVRP
jgi:hypothetical protein